jgi:hypothetical protein
MRSNGYVVNIFIWLFDAPGDLVRKEIFHLRVDDGRWGYFANVEGKGGGGVNEIPYMPHWGACNETKFTYRVFKSDRTSKILICAHKGYPFRINATLGR